jgi:hypothetical protein
LNIASVYLADYLLLWLVVEEAMSNCGGFFERSNYSPKQRMVLFYSACVPVRLMLVVALLVMAWFLPTVTAWIGVVLGTIAFAASLYFVINQGCRWWRPLSGAIVAAAIVTVGIAYLVGGDHIISPLMIGALVLAHLVFGVLLSAYESPWAYPTPAAYGR